MRLKYHFEFTDVENEIIAVPVGEGANDIHGVLKLNPTGKEIMELLMSDTSVENIVSALDDKYEDERENLVSYVQTTVETLKNAGLIEG